MKSDRSKDLYWTEIRYVVLPVSRPLLELWSVMLFLFVPGRCWSADQGVLILIRWRVWTDLFQGCCWSCDHWFELTCFRGVVGAVICSRALLSAPPLSEKTTFFLKFINILQAAQLPRIFAHLALSSEVRRPRPMEDDSPSSRSDRPTSVMAGYRWCCRAGSPAV